MSREALTEEKIMEAYKLMCENRWTYAEIEKKYNISERTLRRYFRRRNLKINKLPIEY